MAAATLPLAKLAEAFPGAHVRGNGDQPITGLFQDSRRVEAGAAFVVRRGDKTDGRAFVEQALAKGASAIVTDDAALAAQMTAPALVVNDVRTSLSALALAAYGHPERHLAIVGVTGTNGKTTTTTLVASMLSANGKPAATLGTLGVRFADRTIVGTHTTPEADDVARTLASLVEQGAQAVAMEVSSHALSLGRVEALPFACAAYLNLTQDHLDFHGSMAAYFDAKARLFEALDTRASVVNIEADRGPELYAKAKGRRLSVSPKNQPADIRTTVSAATPFGTTLLVLGPSGSATFTSPLVGGHNVENLTVAMGIAEALGIPPADAAAALAKAPAVPGRLERVSGEDEPLVLVDYAHTPDALRRTLETARALTIGTLTVVFGCGGDRDSAKRPLMGAVAGRLADRVIVTNDNPRSEAPSVIADAVVNGVHMAGAKAEVELDRAAAIDLAVQRATVGDVVVIAGKGHEPYQIVGAEVRAFDDRDEARRALRERAGR